MKLHTNLFIFAFVAVVCLSTFTAVGATLSPSDADDSLSYSWSCDADVFRPCDPSDAVCSFDDITVCSLGTASYPTLSCFSHSTDASTRVADDLCEDDPLPVALCAHPACVYRCASPHSSGSPSDYSACDGVSDGFDTDSTADSSSSFTSLSEGGSDGEEHWGCDASEECSWDCIATRRVACFDNSTKAITAPSLCAGLPSPATRRPSQRGRGGVCTGSVAAVTAKRVVTSNGASEANESSDKYSIEWAGLAVAHGVEVRVTFQLSPPVLNETVLSCTLTPTTAGGSPLPCEVAVGADGTTATLTLPSVPLTSARLEIDSPYTDASEAEAALVIASMEIATGMIAQVLVTQTTITAAPVAVAVAPPAPFTPASVPSSSPANNGNNSNDDDNVVNPEPVTQRFTASDSSFSLSLLPTVDSSLLADAEGTADVMVRLDFPASAVEFREESVCRVSSLPRASAPSSGEDRGSSGTWARPSYPFFPAMHAIVSKNTSAADGQSVTLAIFVPNWSPSTPLIDVVCSSLTVTTTAPVTVSVSYAAAGAPPSLPATSTADMELDVDVVRVYRTRTRPHAPAAPTAGTLERLAALLSATAATTAPSESAAVATTGGQTVDVVLSFDGAAATGDGVTKEAVARLLQLLAPDWVDHTTAADDDDDDDDNNGGNDDVDDGYTGARSPALLCGTHPDSLSACVPADPSSVCGAPAFTAPAVCVDSGRSNTLLPLSACAFVPGAEEATRGQQEGCGTVMCRLSLTPTSSSSTFETLDTEASVVFVPCTSPLVCETGCSSTPLSITNISTTSGSESPFAPVCVKDGVAVDMATHCPASAVPQAAYALACQPTSACALMPLLPTGERAVTDDEGNSTAAAAAGWSECAPIAPGSTAGLQHRTVVCADDGTVVGAAPEEVVSVEMCQARALLLTSASTPAAAGGNVESSRQCCTDNGVCAPVYQWRCRSTDNSTTITSDSSSDGDEDEDEDNVGSDDASLAGWAVCSSGHFSACSATCGSGVRTRTPTCIAYHPLTGAPVSVGSDTDCQEPASAAAAAGPKPAEEEQCLVNYCVTWSCYDDAERRFKFDCTNEIEGFRPNACSSSPPCFPQTARRSVFCEQENIIVADSVCTAALSTPKPLTSRYCPWRDDGTCAKEYVWTRSSATAPGATCRRTVSNMCAAAMDHTVTCQVRTPPSSDLVDVDGDDEGSCDPETKPASVTQCTQPLTSCNPSGGRCVTTPVRDLYGVEHADVVEGVCECDAGFLMPNCRSPPPPFEITKITLQRYHERQVDVNVRWTYVGEAEGSSNFVTISGSPAPTDNDDDGDDDSHEGTDGADSPQASVTLGRALISRRSTSLSLLPLHEAFPLGGSMVLTLTPIPPIPGAAAAAFSSEPFTLVSLCDASGLTCMNNGTCSTDTGRCECLGEFSGPRCETSPCSSKGCNPAVGACTVDEDGVADCNCPLGPEGEDLFADDLCFTPLGCANDTAVVCLNGGIPTGTVDDNGTAICDGCSCPGNWAGADCGLCGLDEACGSRGVGNSDCSRCACEAGFGGDACECRRVTAAMVFSGAPADWYHAASAEDREQWAGSIESYFTSLLAEYNVTLSLIHAPVTDAAGHKHISLTVVLLGACSPDSPTTLALTAAAAAVEPALEGLYGALEAIKTAFTSGDLAAAPGFEGLNSDAGLGLNDPLCSAESGDEGCPENVGRGGVVDGDDDGEGPGPGQPEEPEGGSKGSGLSSGALAGIIVGSVVGGILLLLLVLSCACGWCCFKKGPESSGAGRTGATSSMEMSSV